MLVLTAIAQTHPPSTLVRQGHLGHNYLNFDSLNPQRASQTPKVTVECHKGEDEENRCPPALFLRREDLEGKAVDLSI
ncbi:hypothetical protein CGMCC3_g3182 [Colletotrichum fructicola]|nr:uncharacterized protein CGMCC3_g3182 [Colletotrichum fructicola]KAE9580942.1 hypothetical protein CGMCC3_g3182 [Colletotrichum fructicola]